LSSLRKPSVVSIETADRPFPAFSALTEPAKTVTLGLGAPPERHQHPCPRTAWQIRASALLSVCDHGGDHMKVVTVRDFRDRASEMFRSDDVILVTRDGAPAGFYLPWDTPELPLEVRREVFLRLSEQIGTQLTEQGTSEQEVLDDFAASGRRR
jgi:hypothetical protein